MRRRRSTLTVLFLLVPTLASAQVEKAGDASIGHDTRAGSWSIRAGGASLVLTLAPTRDFEVASLTTADNKAWLPTASSDTSITVDGSTVAFGRRADGFVYQNVTTSAHDQTLTLDAIFDLSKAGLRVTRHYRVTSGSPTFETWNTYTPIADKAISISDLSAFNLTVPNGTFRWLTGLMQDNSDVAQDGAFTLQQKQLAVHEEFTVGAQGRSSEQVVPWFAVDGGDNGEFYGALMWSGAWTLTAYRPGSNLALQLGLASMTTVVRAQTDGPHALFGVVTRGLPEATAALRSYVLDGIRAGRVLLPLVTYNTWFAYGTRYGASDIYREMDRASELGVELFVVDAGWYLAAGAAGPFDFESGLGSWQVDSGRFPDGLEALTNYAHVLGMKFGLWVEPERIDLSLVGDSNGVDEAWLATADGSYGSDRTGLLCLSNAAARSWIFGRLTALIDEVNPDYLKWDNNTWLNCNRAGHEHGDKDGNFAQVNGLYGVLSQLRDQYPDLIVENVSGGGNRLDLGMLRYSDVAWMDDRTAPSVHVRHNVQGLSVVFPPAYLLSFVTPHADEPLHGAPDMSLYVRSRMEGALGLCFRNGDLSSADVEQMSREIALYKNVRDTLSVAAGALLTDQASPNDGPDWDVLQEATPDGSKMLLCAVQSNEGVDRTIVRPTGLDPATTYDVRSVDAGPLGSATGADLMKNGIELIGSPTSAAHILVLTAR